MTAIRFQLPHLYGFHAVARHRSFTRAAEDLCVTQSAVSYQIKKLESQLKVRLLDRRCRNAVRLTSAGEFLALKCQTVFSELDQAFTSLGGDVVSGNFTIAAPTCFGAAVLPKVVANIKNTHPELKLKLVLEDNLVDLAANNIDVAIRVNGSREGLHYQPLMKVKMQLVVAPEYLIQKDNILSGKDLGQHQLVMVQQEDSDWQALSSRYPDVEISSESVTYINNTLAALEAVRSGIGVGYMPHYLIADDIAEGRLVAILPGMHSTITYFACYHSSLGVELKLSVLLKALAAALPESNHGSAFEWLVDAEDTVAEGRGEAGAQDVERAQVVDVEPFIAPPDTELESPCSADL